MRRLFTLLSALSLLLCAATVVLWVRSLSAADELNLSRAAEIDGRYARTEWSVLSGYGFLQFMRSDRIPADAASAKWLHGLDRRTGLGWSFGQVDGYPVSWAGFAQGLRRIGVYSGSDAAGRTVRRWRSVEVPDWVLLLVVSLPAQPPLIRLVHRRLRARRRAPGGRAASAGTT